MTITPPPPLVVGPLTRTDLVRYQGASGDFYAIHHDEPFARAAGFPMPVSLGMLQAGMLAGWATAWLGAAAIRGVRVRFAGQVFPGDTLTCSGTVVREFVADGEPRVELALICQKQDGEAVVRGSAIFAVTDLAVTDKGQS